MKVLAAMSGGIDSSVSAFLLKEQGYEVVGVFMHNGIQNQSQRSCCSLNDAYDARRVADMLSIPFYSLNLKDYFDQIIDYFVAEYNHGRTPNPCIVCNKVLKFGRLFDYAQVLGIDKIATGHYAIVEGNDARFYLKRAIDQTKDQSYVLFQLSQQQLARTVLPLGQLTKQQVRGIARKAGIRIADKPDSQELCFVPDDDYRKLLRSRPGTNIQPGPIKTIDGRVIGRHNGYQLYTIGQRKSIGSLGRPMYVVDINAAANTIVISDEKDTLRKKMLVRDLNWISINTPKNGFKAKVYTKIRHTHQPALSEIEVRNNHIEVSFDEPQKSITPGQAAVFYQDDVVVGGGWISKVI